MKDLARQFTASETFDKSHTDQLRLLIQPLHRYSDPDHELLDGQSLGQARALLLRIRQG